VRLFWPAIERYHEAYNLLDGINAVESFEEIATYTKRLDPHRLAAMRPELVEVFLRNRDVEEYTKHFHLSADLCQLYRSTAKMCEALRRRPLRAFVYKGR